MKLNNIFPIREIGKGLKSNKNVHNENKRQHIRARGMTGMKWMKLAALVDTVESHAGINKLITFIYLECGVCVTECE